MKGLNRGALHAHREPPQAEEQVSDVDRAIVFDALNTEELVMRTVPPFMRMGSWASIRWLKVSGTGPVPATRSAASGLLVDGGDTRQTLEHVGRFGRTVPVHLANPARDETHV
jgi:hypothetical protein